MATRLNLNIKEIVLDKLAETEKKYPVEKARGTSVKYNKFKEE